MSDIKELGQDTQQSVTVSSYLSQQVSIFMFRKYYTLVVESCPVEIRPLFENPGNLKPGKNKPWGEL